MRGQWNTENASVISADDDAPEPTVAITAGDALVETNVSILCVAARENFSEE